MNRNSLVLILSCMNLLVMASQSMKYDGYSLIVWNDGYVTPGSQAAKDLERDMAGRKQPSLLQALHGLCCARISKLASNKKGQNLTDLAGALRDPNMQSAQQMQLGQQLQIPLPKSGFLPISSPKSWGNK